jgi:hypothetical protein
MSRESTRLRAESAATVRIALGALALLSAAFAFALARGGAHLGLPEETQLPAASAFLIAALVNGAAMLGWQRLVARLARMTG